VNRAIAKAPEKPGWHRNKKPAGGNLRALGSSVFGLLRWEGRPG
jgi:hypothetical protein